MVPHCMSLFQEFTCLLQLQNIAHYCPRKKLVRFRASSLQVVAAVCLSFSGKSFQNYSSTSISLLEKSSPPSEANSTQHRRQRSINLDTPTLEELVILNYTFESAQVCQMLWRKPSTPYAFFDEKQHQDERARAHFEFLHITYERLRYNCVMIHISQGLYIRQVGFRAQNKLSLSSVWLPQSIGYDKEQLERSV